MIPETILLQGKTKRTEFKCPICKVERCGKHCNSCQKIIGEEVEWKLIENRYRLCDKGTEVPHYCMKKGQGVFIKNGIVYEPEKKGWQLYKPLSKQEMLQVEYGRVEYQRLFYNDDFYRQRHIESKIK